MGWLFYRSVTHLGLEYPQCTEEISRLDDSIQIYLEDNIDREKSLNDTEIKIKTQNVDKFITLNKALQ